MAKSTRSGYSNIRANPPETDIATEEVVSTEGDVFSEAVVDEPASEQEAEADSKGKRQ